MHELVGGRHGIEDQVDVGTLLDDPDVDLGVASCPNAAERAAAKAIRDVFSSMGGHQVKLKG